MKISHVEHNNRTRSFVVETTRRRFEFPYASADPVPTPEDPIQDVYVDPEIGREGFTYLLRSGKEGSVHIDHVRSLNRDPSILNEQILYDLTLEAQRAMSETPLRKRMLARLLGTSLSQLARLLDQTYYSKSIPQMIALLGHLGREVTLRIGPVDPARRGKTPRWARLVGPA